MLPETAAQLTGLPEAEAVALCAAQGWPMDEASRTLVVSRRVSPDATRSGHANLAQLSEYMVHLEQ